MCFNERVYLAVPTAHWHLLVTKLKYFGYRVQYHVDDTSLFCRQAVSIPGSWLHRVNWSLSFSREYLARWGRGKMADILQTTLSNAFSWMKIYEFRSLFHRDPINNIPALVQIMAWRRPGDKPLSEPMMVNILTHICATPPQWVKWKHHINVEKFQIYSKIFCVS